MTQNRYTIEKMITTFESGERIEFIFFWGHTRNSVEMIGKSCLSQWYDAGFTFEEIHYRTAEHWMMAQKARLFRDQESFEKVIQSRSPKEAKTIGREVKNFGPDIWNKHKYRIVVEGNTHKFTQNSELFKYLKNTAKKYLIEASPNDSVWGIGISEDNEDIDNPYVWKGENLLGFALMEVRDRLEKLDYFEPLENPKAPPWIEYPEIECGDLFWRMGGGEQYINEYFDWFESLTPTEQEIYSITYPPKNGWNFY